jgi:hypothetical protein
MTDPRNQRESKLGARNLGARESVKNTICTESKDMSAHSDGETPESQI